MGQKKSILLNLMVIFYAIFAVLFSLMAAMGLAMNGLEACMSQSGHSKLFCSLMSLLPPNIPLIIICFFFKKLWKPIKFLILSWLSFISLLYVNDTLALMVASIFGVSFIVTLLEYMTPHNKKKK